MFKPQQILHKNFITEGKHLKKFLEHYNITLDDVSFDTGCRREWSDYRTAVVEYYRDPTPSEVEQQLSEYTKRIEQETNRKYAQYEALKKEFEQKESLNENSK